MNIALYARVSTLDKGQNPEVQLAELRQAATFRGWKVIKEYVDEGQSGVKARRPALNELLTDIRKNLPGGKINVVMVQRLDRLGRSLVHLLNLIEEFNEGHAALVSLKEQIDFTTPAGRFFFQMVGAMAEFEREIIRERIRAGLEWARSKGRRGGRRSKIDFRVYGTIKDMRGPKEAPTMSIGAIAKKMGMSKTTVSRILKGVPQTPKNDPTEPTP